MFLPKLSQIATPIVITLDDQHTIQQAVDLMAEKALGTLVITGQEGYRFLTTRDLIVLRISEVSFETPLHQTQLTPATLAPSSSSIIDCLNLLREHKSEHLCIINNDQLAGYLSYSDITTHLDPHYFADAKKISDLIHLASYIAVKETDSLKSAFIQLERHQQTSALVKSATDYVGIVTQSDITRALKNNDNWLEPISSIMTHPLLTVDESVSIQKALAISKQHKIKRLIVANEQGTVLGVLHQKYIVSLVFEGWRDLVQAQHKKEQELLHLSESIPGILYQFILEPNQQKRFSFISAKFEALFGLSKSDILANSNLVFERFHPDDLAILEKTIAKSAEELTACRVELRMTSVNGTERWIETQGMPQKQDDGKIIWHAHIQDITERKQQELELAETQKRYEITLNATHTGLWDWDIPNNHVQWSDTAFTQLGYTPQAFEVSPEKVKGLTHPDDWNVFVESAKQMESADDFSVQFRLKSAQNQWLWIEGRGKVVSYDDQNRPLRIMGTHTLIQKQKEIFEQLQQSEAKFRLLFDLSPEATVLIDKETEMPVQFNKQAHEELGYTAEEFTQLRVTDYAINLTDKGLEDIRQQIIKNGKIDCEMQLRCKSGEILEMLTTIRPIQFNHKTYFLGVRRNITKAKQYEQVLQQAKKEAEAANQAKSDFLANMSHEIRTPMNGIIGLSELGMKTNDPTEMHDRLCKINQSGLMLLSILNDVLDFSKIEAGKMQISAQPFKLSKIVEFIKEFFQEAINYKHLAIHFNLPTDLPDAYIGDELRLRQVFINLLGNAIKFTKQGFVALTVRLKSAQNNQAWLHFEVSDSGQGISKAQQQKLFKPFSQADNSITREHGGSGLGLVICQRLVSAMNGSAISVASEPNKGSQFSFELPLELCSNQQIQNLTAQEKAISEIPHGYFGRVLLVEDNPINQEVATAQLEQHGLEVIIAPNGQVAIEKTQNETFDLILMDIQMPILDGYQAAKAIRQHNQSVPIIALTAAAMVEDREKALAVGMNEHLAKPIDQTQLANLLDQYLKPNYAIVKLHHEQTTGSTGVATKNKLRILIVDDIPTNIKILANSLKDDYLVQIANNGHKALQIAESDTPPDLIMLDIVMPEMDGYEVCRALKNNPKTNHIPIIFVSGLDDALDEESGLDLGAVDYITKPFHIPIVKARIRNHLNLKIKTDLLSELSNMDGLTHVANRRYFDSTLETEVHRMIRNDQMLGIIMIDIDYFKPFNDNYGHGLGDKCLIDVATTLSHTLHRAGELLARYGGEEFMVLLPNPAPKDVAIIAEKLRLAVDNLKIPHLYSKISDHVTISVGGVSAKLKNLSDAQALLKKADEALYEAKSAGRNQVKIAENLND